VDLGREQPCRNRPGCPPWSSRVSWHSDNPRARKTRWALRATLVDRTLCGTIEACAAESNLPVDIFTRLIWQESTLRLDTTSPAGVRVSRSSCQAPQLNALTNPTARLPTPKADLRRGEVALERLQTVVAPIRLASCLVTIVIGGVRRDDYPSAFSVQSSGWPLKYIRKALSKITLSPPTAANSVIEDRNFKSSGLPKIS
jgi:hypothetical protein